MEAGSITVIGAIPRGSDPDSGAEITQLTSDPAIHEDIYGEVPYMDASSRWLMYITGVRPYPHYPGEIWRADLHSRWLTPVCENVPGISGIAVGPDQRYFYCQRQYAEDECEIVRTEIATLEQETYRIENLPEVRSMASVAPDNATYIFATKLDRQLFGIVKCDLEAREWAIIHEGTDICNAHPQIEPGKGEDYLIQHNRGCEFDDEGRCIRLTGDIGATLYLIDSAGGNYRELPVGQPHTWRVQGHQCWIGDSGEILLTVSGPDADEMEKKGNLLAMPHAMAAFSSAMTGPPMRRSSSARLRPGRSGCCAAPTLLLAGRSTPIRTLTSVRIADKLFTTPTAPASRRSMRRQCRRGCWRSLRRSE